MIYFIAVVMCMVAQSSYAASLKASPSVFTQDKPAIINQQQSEFTLKLKSNPTTGYSWFLTDYNEKIIMPVKHSYQAPISQLVGASGYELWTFRIKTAGFIVPQQTTLQFVYARPWEKTNDSKPFVFKITTVDH